VLHGFFPSVSRTGPFASTAFVRTHARTLVIGSAVAEERFARLPESSLPVVGAVMQDEIPCWPVSLEVGRLSISARPKGESATRAQASDLSTSPWNRGQPKARPAKPTPSNPNTAHPGTQCHTVHSAAQLSTALQEPSTQDCCKLPLRNAARQR